MISPALAHSTSTTQKSFTRHMLLWSISATGSAIIRNYNICQNNLDAFLVLKGLHIMGSTAHHRQGDIRSWSTLFKCYKLICTKHAKNVSSLLITHHRENIHVHTSYVYTTSWWSCVLPSSFSVVTHTLLMNLTATNVATATNAEQTNMMLLYSVELGLLHPNSSRLNGDTSLHTHAHTHTQHANAHTYTAVALCRTVHCALTQPVRTTEGALDMMCGNMVLLGKSVSIGLHWLFI